MLVSFLFINLLILTGLGLFFHNSLHFKTERLMNAKVLAPNVNETLTTLSFNFAFVYK